MTYDNFTVKAQEAILKAQKIAAGLEQQQVDTVHIVKGILEIDEHVPEFLFQKMNINIPLLKRKLEEEAKKYPKIEGTEKQFLTNEANKSLSRAKKMLSDFGDE
ncbi:MAG: type VI secretion system ATPase TssH, partial [Bacteroidetes bacterium]|nr:type VI secretion system ATPase TssH [Bacteroidota bacterium]